MIRVITSLSYDASILPHWIPYYLALGIDDILIEVNAPDSEFSDSLAKMCRSNSWPVTLIPMSKEPATAGPKALDGKKDYSKERIRRLIAKSGDWIIPADVDEFIQFPAPLSDLTRQMADRGCNHLAGALVDRLDETGELAPLRAAPSIWAQYPIACDLTKNLVRGCIDKVTLASALCELGAGHHHAKHGRAMPDKCAVHHFKWREGVLVALSRREQFGRQHSLPVKARESRVVLDYFHKHKVVKLADFNPRTGWNPSLATRDARKIAVIGLYRSGSSAIAGALHHLGVDMGGPFKEPYYEPDDLSGQLRVWWAEQKLDEPSGYATLLQETVKRPERVAQLARWLRVRKQGGALVIGVKHPLLCLTGNDLRTAWGADTRFIWAYRPLKESIASLERLGWWPDSAKAQRRLWAESTAFFEQTPHLRVDHKKLLQHPAKEIARIIEYAGITPTPAQIRAAIGFIQPKSPERAAHSTNFVPTAHSRSKRLTNSDKLGQGQPMASPVSAPDRVAKLSISNLKRTADLRPKGFVDAVLARGKIEGDYVLLDLATILDLSEEFPDPGIRPEKDTPVTAPPKPVVTFSVSSLKATAEQKPKGYVDFILARGKIDDDQVSLDAAALAELRARFSARPALSALPPDGKFRLDAIKAAVPRRPPGYLDFILAHGKIENEMVTLDEATLQDIREKFPPLPPPRLREPTVAEMATNFTQAMGDWVQAGFAVVGREIYEQRHAICLGCEYWDAKARAGLGKCKRCGCSRAKLWLASSKCPLNPPKWERQTG